MIATMNYVIIITLLLSASHSLFYDHYLIIVLFGFDGFLLSSFSNPSLSPLWSVGKVTSKKGSSAWNGVQFRNAEHRCVSRLVRERPLLFCREKQPPTHHPVWSPFQKPLLAKFETPGIFRRRHDVTAKLTRGPLEWHDWAPERVSASEAAWGGSWFVVPGRHWEIREIAVVHCWLF